MHASPMASDDAERSFGLEPSGSTGGGALTARLETKIKTDWWWCARGCRTWVSVGVGVIISVGESVHSASVQN